MMIPIKLYNYIFSCLNDLFFLLFFLLLLFFIFFFFFFFSLNITSLNHYIFTTSFIMHLLCISFFCLCVWMILFFIFIDPHFFDIYLLFMFIFIYLYVSTYCLFFQLTKVLSIISSATPPFQKICGNCQVPNVIIFPTGGVHYNVCCSKSIVQILNSLHGPTMNLCY
jgi:hypothetical protein